ncbi:amidase [Microlunatus parietis]|uniref:Asp-tRNA(Asn)/Glu-tRNA(Gln) amidotransferase A subunit family amidase n=1 Tax=Microlunatus parietis TaxID=682979 RepID=A0A7Y9IDZ7_9ACTN|nr:amidase [Microlunatus parietis]NYE75069.1 Asp-tRNA(Asn)/Glu-tRNA(Gln) amidotransferase A subunit family amidase [Microlunatus parietis]
MDDLLTRIEAENPRLRAFVDEPDRRERLRRDLDHLAQRWPDPSDRPPLFALPVAVKDVFHVAGLPTRAGSRLPAELITGEPGPLITSLLDAGAVVLGKTVTAEFAFLAPGETRNPHRLEHSPGGSSSGSAAAVAAGLAPIALGTQTVGSVIRPAAYCGILGFKPTFGRIGSEGVIANAPTFDTVGFLAADSDVLVRVAAATLPDWQPTDSAALPTLVVPRGAYLDQAEPVAHTAFERHLDVLREVGYQVHDVEMLDDIEQVNQRNFVINGYELARSHDAWFDDHAVLYHPRTAAAIRDGRTIDRRDYEAALRERAVFADALMAALAGIDAYVAPAATGPAPHGLDTTGSPLMNLPWTQARLPVLGLPAGRTDDGLPLGVQFAAAPGRDEALLGWAAGLVAALAKGHHGPSA